MVIRIQTNNQNSHHESKNHGADNDNNTNNSSSKYGKSNKLTVLRLILVIGALMVGLDVLFESKEINSYLPTTKWKDDAIVSGRNGTSTTSSLLQMHDIGMTHHHHESVNVNTTLATTEEETNSKNVIVVVNHPNTTNMITKSIQRSGPNDDKLPIPNFLFHIPKTGGEYAMYTLQSIWHNYFVQHQRQEEGQQVGKTTQYTRACNVGTKRLSNFDRPTFEKDYQGVPCSLWMSESRYESRPVQKFTVLRDPSQHVLSQYFHCTEGKRPGWKKARMTNKNITLGVWLETWLSIYKKDTNGKIDDYDTTNTKYSPVSYTPRANKYFEDTQCYNPTNMQSYYANFDVRRQSKEELSQRYDVLGDTSQMHKTICMMLIKYIGDIPRPWCDCTPTYDDDNDSNTTTESNPKAKYLKYDSNKHGHGVKHHGASYETTDWQNTAIATLTKYDQQLYDWGIDIFQKQVEEVERYYHIQICDKFRES